MGTYLNPSNNGFAEALRSKIYVDKTGLAGEMNGLLGTKQKYACVSRPRRFGKTMAVEMLTAYYSRGCDSRDLFASLEIAGEPSFETHLNKYNVIFLNTQSFLSRAERDADRMIALMRDELSAELRQSYSSINGLPLTRILEWIYTETGIGFIIIIDEWDCVFREKGYDKAAREAYLDFLRDLLKDRDYTALAYMTGILPIKKYGTHSALNMFSEYSMTDPQPLARYIGFTAGEVKRLCEKHSMDYGEITEWYDGYRFPGAETIYSPKSVVEAITRKRCSDYWNQTETYEALRIYVDMNFDGLKDTVIELLAGGRNQIDARTFTNDMTTFESRDDVLTLLIHLGYLGYDADTREVFIPNKEIADEFVSAVKGAGWDEAARTVRESEELLQAAWRQDARAVAEYLEKAHGDVSHLVYNDENALSYAVSLAFYTARQYYEVVREMPAGKGFADLLFRPRKKYPDKPAMIVELKWNRSAVTAIRQIEDRDYAEALKGFAGEVLLIGINYSKKTKKHTCVIKKLATP